MFVKIYQVLIGFYKITFKLVLKSSLYIIMCKNQRTTIIIVS